MAKGMSRREFVERSARLAVLAGLGGSLLAACGSSGGSVVIGPSLPLARLDKPGHAARQRLRPGQSGAAAGDRHAQGSSTTPTTSTPTRSPRSSRRSARRSSSPPTTPRTSCSPTSRNESLEIRRRDRRDHAQPAPHVAGNLIQPLNKDYLTNFANVLPSLQSPVLRRRLEVHGALHRVHHRRGLPPRRHRRRDLRRRRRVEAAVGPDLQGLRRRDRRHARGAHARHVLPRRDRHQHRRPGDHRCRRGRHQGPRQGHRRPLRHPRLPEDPRGHARTSTRPGRGDMVAALQYLPEGTDRRRARLLEAGAHHGGQRLLRHPGPLGAAGAGPLR